MLSNSVECRFRRRRVSPALVKYNRYFEGVRRSLKDVNDAAMLTRYEQFFYKNLTSKQGDIKSKKINFKLEEDIDALVNAYSFDKDLGTFSYGTKTNNAFIKVMICGARGSAKNKKSEGHSTLALSEIVELDSTAVAIAYGNKISDTDFVLDAKVDQKKISMSVNKSGQLIISSTVGNKYMLKHLKTVVGVTKMRRLVIGVDYIKFEVNLLVAGASIKKDNVISKSIIKISTYLVMEGKRRCRQNLGLFTSENKTNLKNSKSSHFGLLKVDKHNITDIKTSEGLAKANQKTTKVDAVYNEFKLLSERSRKSRA
jgi:hypothetical protein